MVSHLFFCAAACLLGVLPLVMANPSYQTLSRLGAVSVFRKPSEARVFTKSNAVSVIAVLDAAHDKYDKCFRQATAVWEKGGVGFAVGVNLGDAFSEKFGDPRTPALYAQLNFREDGSLRRGKKRVVGFYDMDDGSFSHDGCVQRVVDFFYATLLRPIMHFPGETDATERVHMGLVTSVWPKVLVPFKRIPDDAYTMLTELATHEKYRGKLHFIACDMNDASGNTNALLKNLQISPRPSEAYSLLFFDPLGAKHRPGRQDPALAFKPANGKVEKEEIIKWLDGFLSERPDIPQTIDSTASENKNAPPKKKKKKKKRKKKSDKRKKRNQKNSNRRNQGDL